MVQPLQSSFGSKLKLLVWLRPAENATATLRKRSPEEESPVPPARAEIEALGKSSFPGVAHQPSNMKFKKKNAGRTLGFTGV